MQEHNQVLPEWEYAVWTALQQPDEYSGKRICRFWRPELLAGLKKVSGH